MLFYACILVRVKKNSKMKNKAKNYIKNGKIIMKICFSGPCGIQIYDQQLRRIVFKFNFSII